MFFFILSPFRFCLWFTISHLIFDVKIKMTSRKKILKSLDRDWIKFPVPMTWDMGTDCADVTAQASKNCPTSGQAFYYCLSIKTQICLFNPFIFYHFVLLFVFVYDLLSHIQVLMSSKKWHKFFLFNFFLRTSFLTWHIIRCKFFAHYICWHISCICKERTN